MGTVQVQATSGTLTFKPYIGGTAAQTPTWPPRGSAAGPVAFWLETYVSVSTTGTSGTDAGARPGRDGIQFPGEPGHLQHHHHGGERTR